MLAWYCAKVLPKVLVLTTGALVYSPIMHIRVAHQTCKAGEWTRAGGTGKTDTVCAVCNTGRFRANAPTDNKAENQTSVCMVHKRCRAGEWTRAGGTGKTDTVCAVCDTGRFRANAPTDNTAENQTSVCMVHKRCRAGEWTRAGGSEKTDTECAVCDTGRFRANAPTDNTAENRTSVCMVHKRCRAGEWTSAVGTSSSDVQCTPCVPGTARALAPPNNTVLETASDCPPCLDPSLYADEAGLSACKGCPRGHFGVVEARARGPPGHFSVLDPHARGGGSRGGGGHKACEDDACERPTDLPAHAILVKSQCPDHGKQAATGRADTCVLACEPGYYSSSTETPFECAPNGNTTQASYQGGAITCTGRCALRLVCVCVCVYT